MKNHKVAALFLTSLIIAGCSQTAILPKAQPVVSKEAITDPIDGVLAVTDKPIMNNVLQNALEIFEENKEANWLNPVTGNSGVITITKTTKVGADNYCREYSHAGLIDGKARKSTGKACRISSGNWQKVN
jgi:surface antigen